MFHIAARTRELPVTCPDCGRGSARVHSRYSRTLADVAVGGRPVRIVLLVRRLFCDSADCDRRTFTEQVDGLTVRYQRRSPLLQQLVETAGVLLAGHGVGPAPAHLEDAAIAHERAVPPCSSRCTTSGSPSPAATSPKAVWTRSTLNSPKAPPRCPTPRTAPTVDPQCHDEAVEGVAVREGVLRLRVVVAAAHLRRHGDRLDHLVVGVGRRAGNLLHVVDLLCRRGVRQRAVEAGP